MKDNQYIDVEKITTDYMNDQIGQDMFDVVARFGGTSIEVFKRGKRSTSEASKNEFGEMAGELVNILSDKGFHGFRIYSFTPYSFSIWQKE